MINIHKSSFIAESAVIIGNVTIGKNCGIYPHAVIRGDENPIDIGDGTNVQDCCVIHVDKDHKVKIGSNVSVGHAAMIHGATIGDECLIGIHATILNGAHIGKGSIIGANALVTEYMKVPKNSLIVGIPGKVVKQDVNFIREIRENAETYKRLSLEYRQGKFPIYKNK
jgi:carbonic anhydrase/acetyltransferase-like protein (isoleucine patch superfamily)